MANGNGQDSGGGGPFGFNSIWDILNGGGRGGTFMSPRDGYQGLFDPSGIGGLLGNSLFPFFGLGGAGGRWAGNKFEDWWSRRQGGGSGPSPSGEGGSGFYNPMDPFGFGMGNNPWAGGGGGDSSPSPGGGGVSNPMDPFGFGVGNSPWAGGGGGTRTVEVGNEGAVGDAHTMFPNFGGDYIGPRGPMRRLGGRLDGVIGNPNVSLTPEAMLALEGDRLTPEAIMGGGRGPRMPDPYGLAALFGGVPVGNGVAPGRSPTDFLSYLLPMGGRKRKDGGD